LAERLSAGCDCLLRGSRLNSAEDAWLEVGVSTLLEAGFGRRGPIICMPTCNAPVRGGNCLIACSDEIERDRTAVLMEDRQSPAIAAKTRTYREFNTHVFQGGSSQRRPQPNGDWGGSGRGS